MQVETIRMDPEIARVHFQRYRQAVRVHREERKRALEEEVTRGGRIFRSARKAKSLLEKEDEELLTIYKSLCAGERVLNLPQVLSKAGLDTKKRLPLLAIAEADAKWCNLRIQSHSRDRAYCFYDERANTWSEREKKHKMWFSRDTFPAELWNIDWRDKNELPTSGIRAAVPSIPPHLRPDRPEKFHILWEAVWEHSPPVDPILLKRITETHFVVVAQWDLTDVEQSVLAGRFS